MKHYNIIDSNNNYWSYNKCGGKKLSYWSNFNTKKDIKHRCIYLYLTARIMLIIMKLSGTKTNIVEVK